MPEDQDPSVSLDQIHEVAEETTVLIVDKVVSVSEVTCEKVETNHTNHQDNVELHNFGAESDLGIHPGEGKQVM